MVLTTEERLVALEESNIALEDFVCDYDINLIEASYELFNPDGPIEIPVDEGGANTESSRQGELILKTWCVAGPGVVKVSTGAVLERVDLYDAYSAAIEDFYEIAPTYSLLIDDVVVVSSMTED